MDGGRGQLRSAAIVIAMLDKAWPALTTRPSGAHGGGKSGRCMTLPMARSRPARLETANGSPQLTANHR